MAPSLKTVSGDPSDIFSGQKMTLDTDSLKPYDQTGPSPGAKQRSARPAPLSGSALPAELSGPAIIDFTCDVVKLSTTGFPQNRTVAISNGHFYLLTSVRNECKVRIPLTSITRASLSHFWDHVLCIHTVVRLCALVRAGRPLLTRGASARRAASRTLSW